MSEFKLKVAVYLDQLSNDPFRACEIASQIGLTHVCLRRVWSTNICKADRNSDFGTFTKDLADKLKSLSLEVALISSDLGKSSAEQITRELDHIPWAIQVCKLFNCNYLGLMCGRRSNHPSTMSSVDSWMSMISDLTLSANIVPTAFLGHGTVFNEPVDISGFLRKYKRWKVIYDPAALVLLDNVDPFKKFWSLFRNRISHLSLRDGKPGSSKIAPGRGKSQLERTISDCVLSQYTDWVCLDAGENILRPDDNVTVAFSQYLAALEPIVAKAKATDQFSINFKAQILT